MYIFNYSFAQLMTVVLQMLHMVYFVNVFNILVKRHSCVCLVELAGLLFYPFSHVPLHFVVVDLVF